MNISKIILLTDSSVGSYTIIGALYCATLRAGGFVVEERPYPLTEREREKYAREFVGATFIHNTIGPRFEPLPACHNIATPIHEWSGYPAAWVARLNRFDEVWVATRHVEELLLKAGVVRPVRRLPPALTIDAPVQKTEENRSGALRFLSVGEAHFRKGFHLLMEGFLAAFPKPGEAELVIKTSAGCDWESPSPHIRIVAEWLEKEKLDELYCASDVYVTASLGEGLDLPVCEAISRRIPVAANYWGARRCLFEPGSENESFFAIPFVETEQVYCSRPDYYAPGQRCAYSSPAAIAETLRAIMATSSPKRWEMSQRAAVWLRGNFHEDVTVPLLVAALDSGKGGQDD